MLKFNNSNAYSSKLVSKQLVKFLEWDPRIDRPIQEIYFFLPKETPYLVYNPSTEPWAP